MEGRRKGTAMNTEAEVTGGEERKGGHGEWKRRKGQARKREVVDGGREGEEWRERGIEGKKGRDRNEGGSE